MKTKILCENGAKAEITLTLPGKVLGDIKKIASHNKTEINALVYSYIVDGITSDSFVIRQMKRTDKSGSVTGKNKKSLGAVEDLLQNLVY